MAVFYNENDRTITIQTKKTTYQMKVDALGTLRHTYYGKKTSAEDMSYASLQICRGHSGSPHEVGLTNQEYTLDTIPLEVSFFGIGDFRITAIHMEQEDGSRALHLRYESHEVKKEKYTIPNLPASYDDTGKAETLIVHMQDEEAKVGVDLYYGIFEEEDVITRSMKIVNRGTEDKKILKAGAMSLDMPSGEFDVITFYGKWGAERHPDRKPVTHGVTSVGSVRGSSSSHYNPSALLVGKNTTEDYGKAYGFTHVYSGDFLFEVEKDQSDATRVIMGIHPDNFRWNLSFGESFMTPEVLMTYSDEGMGLLSNNFHKFIRKHIVRGPWRDKRRPTLINNWEGTYFDFTGEKLLRIAEDGKNLGLELFVLDDGWFGKREGETSGLGDWVPNEKKLCMSMQELGKKINEMGMQFGLWFEPEAISEDSDLYRAHPEYAIKIPGRLPNLSRCELLIDMSRKDVQDFLIEQMSKIIRAASITYVKWDFNRNLSDAYTLSLPKERQGEMVHRFMMGTYRVLDALLTEFPNLLIEGCSAGGGRFDAGMLYYTPQIWCSDNSDAIARLGIQYGTSFIYPPSSMGAHVSKAPNHQTGRLTPMETRAMVAMSGTFGYELDLNELTDDERAEVKREMKVFKALYDVLQQGNYYRLTSPYSETCTVWEQAKEDGSIAVVNAVYHNILANPAQTVVQLKGLKEDAYYQMQLMIGHGGRDLPKDQQAIFDGSRKYKGDTLMNCGFYIPQALKEYQSWQIVVKEV